jgi:hypothetical protein
MRQLFDDVVTWRGVLFRADYRDHVKDAWEDIKRNVLPNLMEAPADAPLKDVGLEAGSVQLEMKLAGFNDALAAFRLGGTVALFRPVLKWINTILGSLGRVLPGADIIKEFKESVEHGLDAAERNR